MPDNFSHESTLESFLQGKVLVRPAGQPSRHKISMKKGKDNETA